MQNINQYIEHTLLRPDATHHDIDKVVQEGLEYQFKGICVPPFWVKKARRDLGETEVQLITTSGFPFGNNKTETKIFEIEQAIQDGADEVDIVWNLSAFKAEMSWVKNDIAKCAEVMHRNNKILKVILETAYLNEDEIIAGCIICRDAGADFVKTSTGFAYEGASVKNIKLMRSTLPSSVGIKAAGGIRDYSTALALIKAGADRIGTSSGVSIVEEARAS
jgi:deoxyribose-phosphate aldolase